MAWTKDWRWHLLGRGATAGPAGSAHQGPGQPAERSQWAGRRSTAAMAIFILCNVMGVIGLACPYQTSAGYLLESVPRKLLVLVHVVNSHKQENPDMEFGSHTIVSHFNVYIASASLPRARLLQLQL